MTKVNKTFLSLVIFMLALSSTFMYTNAYASDDLTKFIYGKVLYTDNHAAVTSGRIKIIIAGKSDRTETIIEESIISPTGVFRIKSIPPQTADGIKIMAYPNDVDVLPDAFETLTMDIGKALVNFDNEFAIILEVKRNENIKSNKNEESGLQNNFLLKQNFPNPFNPSTLIKFELAQISKVTLKVYDMSGKVVATLADNQVLNPGANQYTFNAGNLPSGIYVYSLNAGSFTENRKMILIK
ncbi:MAG: T9SS type A sorting domain-containing protein [bacterium]